MSNPIIENFRKELKSKNISEIDQEVIFKLLTEIYIGQNIREEGVLQSQFLNPEKPQYEKIRELIQRMLDVSDLGLIIENEFYGHKTFKTIDKGFTVAMQILIEKIKKSDFNKIFFGVETAVLRFLIFEYFSKSLSYPVIIENDYVGDWRDSILLDKRVWEKRTKILRGLEGNGLSIITKFYVLIRSETREDRFVISPEVQRYVIDYLKAFTTGLDNNDKKSCLIYHFLGEMKFYLSNPTIETEKIKEIYWNKLQELGLEDGDIKEIVNEMFKKGLTGAYKGIFVDDIPFVIKDKLGYDAYIKTNLLNKVVDSLFAGRTKTEEKTKEEQVKEGKRPIFLTREERMQFYDEIAGIEIKLRNFILKKLKERYKSEWLNKAKFIYNKKDLKKKWEKIRTDESAEGILPDENILNYAFLLDCKKIIISNWDIFSPYFKDDKDSIEWGNFEQKLNNLNKLGRNPIMHFRKVESWKHDACTMIINYIKVKIEK